MSIFPGLNSNDVEDHVKTGFWKRQFIGSATAPQITFDLLFGVVGPILCFIFDPIVFHPGLAGPALFPDYQTVVYLFSGIEIILLCFWLITGPGHELSNATIGGALFTGGLFCLTIGCLLVPFSLLGLMFFGIGLFGFTPFLTALVYARNGWRALHARSQAPAFTRIFGAVCGLLVVLSIPITLSLQIRSAVATSVNDIVSGDPERASHAAQKLAVLRFFASADVDRIVQAYIAERNEGRKQILKSCYRNITGADIETRVLILQD